jgi:hypothetical protein
MTRFMNSLAAVALATALMPIAANAMTVTPRDQVQTHAHQAISAPQRQVQRVAGNADATLKGQTIVQSGATGQLYPLSFGG